MTGPSVLLAHQTSAVELLDRLLRDHGGALLADPPGTGKSWIAAAIARAWEDAGARIHFVVPATLRSRWIAFLADWGSGAQVVSHDSIRPSDGADLVIVDEAHRFRNPSTRRYARLAILCSGATVLLVTATPLVNSPLDLVSLLRLFLSDDALAGFGVASIEDALERDAVERIGAAAQAFTVRRGIADISGVALPAVEEEVIAFDAGERSQEIEQLIASLEFPGALQESPGVLRAMLWRRFLSSPAAIEGTLRRQLQYLRRLGEAESRGWTFPRAMHRRCSEESEAEQGILFPEAFCAEPAHPQEPAAARERAILENILSLIRSRTVDRKLRALESVTEHRRPVLVFTESAETARYLWRNAGSRWSAGLITASEARRESGRRCAVGEVISAFQRGDVDVLVSTDLAAEGVDLQRARTVIHYDLPWSRVRIQQRAGRAARLGSSGCSVLSILFVPRATENRPLERIDEKQRRCERMFSRPPGAPTPDVFVLPRVGRAAPQHRLARRLRERGLLDVHLSAALSRRYRAGVEVMLRELQNRGPLPDALLRRSVLRALDRQRAIRTAVPSPELGNSHAAKGAGSLF